MVTGLGDISIVSGIRDPVTTMFWLSYWAIGGGEGAGGGGIWPTSLVVPAGQHCRLTSGDTVCTSLSPVSLSRLGSPATAWVRADGKLASLPLASVSHANRSSVCSSAAIAAT